MFSINRQLAIYQQHVVLQLTAACGGGKVCSAEHFTILNYFAKLLVLNGKC